MAVRVREFSRAHPFTDPSAQAVLARFEERLTRAESLAVQQRTGQLETMAANARRESLRAAPLTGLLRHLVRVGREAKDVPELAGKFRLPPVDGSHQAFLAGARSLVTQAKGLKEVLVQHGMTDEMLAELEQALAGFEAVTDTASIAKRQRVGATGEVVSVVRELMGSVRLLDGLNKFRFRGDSEKLGEWRNVASVLGDPAPKPEATGTEKGGTPSAA